MSVMAIFRQLLGSCALVLRHILSCMPLRRFSMLPFLFALLHGALIIVSELIVVGAGFNLDHPEVQSSYPQRVFGILLSVLMQPGATVWERLRVTPRSSLIELLMLLFNSFLCGVTEAAIVVMALLASSLSAEADLTKSQI